MEKKKLEEDVLLKIKTLPKINYDAYLELIRTNQIERLVKFKGPKTVFFDEETEMFIYVNPYHGRLMKCGKFKTIENDWF